MGDSSTHLYFILFLAVRWRDVMTHTKNQDGGLVVYTCQTRLPQTF